MSKRKQGNSSIPFVRDEKGKIKYSPVAKALVKDILDPSIRFVEAEGAVRASKDVYGLAAYAKVLDRHDNTFHLAIASSASQAQLLILDADGFGIMHHYPNGYIGEIQDKTAFIFVDSRGRDKYLIIAGGALDNSFKGIRGMNYGTVYANESNLLHIKTLEECKRRIMASTMPKMVMTQNPDTPTSDFYEKFELPLTRPGDQKYYNDNPNNVWNGPQFRYHHFTQYDNPSLTLKMISENLLSFASEVDKQRNFDGLRVAAEGAIFDMITSSNFYRNHDGTINQYQKYNWDRLILIDYGTTNPMIFIDCFVDENFEMYWDREYRWDSVKEGRQKTDDEYVDDLKKFIRSECDGEYNYVIVDPSAASFIAACKVSGIVVISADNTVMGKYKDTEDSQKKSTQGIKLVQIGFARNKIHVNEDECVGGIKELRSYKWDPKAKERGIEQPLKSNDHYPDAGRYGVNTHIKYATRWGVRMN